MQENSKQISTGIPKRKEEIQCNICFEVLNDIKAIIDCGHIYCPECIKTWANHENTCPLCKKEFVTIREKKIMKLKEAPIKE